jgi:hypothetical protein
MYINKKMCHYLFLKLRTVSCVGKVSGVVLQETESLQAKATRIRNLIICSSTWSLSNPLLEQQSKLYIGIQYCTYIF